MGLEPMVVSAWKADAMAAMRSPLFNWCVLTWWIAGSRTHSTDRH